MKHWILVAAIGAMLCACTSLAINDPHFVLDPPAHNLRGATPKDDRPESDCDPVKQADGSVQYQCVVHTFASYSALLKQISRLQAQLKACQQGKP